MKHHRGREEQRALPANGVRMPIALPPTAVQISARPRPSVRITRDAKNEPSSAPTPPAEITTPRRNGSRCRSLMRNSVYSTPIERAGRVGDDGSRARSGTGFDGGGRAGGPRGSRGGCGVGVVRGRPGGSGDRISSSEIAETRNETASIRIANGAADELDQAAGKARAADLGDRRARRELAVAVDDPVDADQRRHVGGIRRVEHRGQAGLERTPRRRAAPCVSDAGDIRHRDREQDQRPRIRSDPMSSGRRRRRSTHAPAKKPTSRTARLTDDDEQRHLGRPGAKDEQRDERARPSASRRSRAGTRSGRSTAS